MVSFGCFPYLNTFFFLSTATKTSETAISTADVTALPASVSFATNIPGSEFARQWNKTHSHTLPVVFLIPAKANDKPRTLIPNSA